MRLAGEASLFTGLASSKCLDVCQGVMRLSKAMIFCGQSDSQNELLSLTVVLLDLGLLFVATVVFYIDSRRSQHHFIISYRRRIRLSIMRQLHIVLVLFFIILVASQKGAASVRKDSHRNKEIDHTGGRSSISDKNHKQNHEETPSNKAAQDRKNREKEGSGDSGGSNEAGGSESASKNGSDAKGKDRGGESGGDDGDTPKKEKDGTTTRDQRSDDHSSRMTLSSAAVQTTSNSVTTTTW